MINHKLSSSLKYFWERDYRSILQGLRSTLAVFVVVLIFVYYQDISLFFMGLCALGLSQSSVRTMYWRFEVNMFFAFFLSLLLIFISYAYSQFILTTYLFLFLITFLLFICSYFQISGIFSIWLYFIPLNSVMTIRSYNDFIKFLLMNTIAFSICYLISVLIIPPKIKKECYYELKSVIHEINSYLRHLEFYMLDKSDKNSLILTRKRDRIFLRLKNIRILLNEINLYIKNGKEETKKSLLPFALVLRYIEKYIENILGISIKLRTIHFSLEFDELWGKLIKLLIKTNNDFLKYFSNIRLVNLNDLGIIYEKLYLNTLVECNIIDKKYAKYLESEIYLEIHALFFQFKDNLRILFSEYKILSKEKKYVSN